MSETPAEAEPTEAEPAVTEPVDTEPVGTEPVEADPGVSGGELAALTREFVAALAREQELAAAREAVITRLHGELEQLRRGEVEQALDVVRRPLIRLHDRIRQQADRVDEPLSVEELRVLLRALADETADALAASGVERYEAREGDAYDASRHRPLGRVPAGSAEEDRLVGRVVTAGFEQGERVVRKSEVFVTHWAP
ncbi:nucleotide exchange factor GrpE [Streptomyces sp. NPDC059783]|uniref:nucleotide exchange factor GrpE n=1 Tax=Streptomyces sp. NPDC059783 TaxID=3346944 RepID=UPI003656E163